MIPRATIKVDCSRSGTAVAQKAVVNGRLNNKIACAWCRRGIQLIDRAFPTFFTAASPETSGAKIVHVTVPAQKRVLPMFVPRPGSDLNKQGAELVAICCSRACQTRLEEVWRHEESRSLAAN